MRAHGAGRAEARGDRHRGPADVAARPIEHDPPPARDASRRRRGGRRSRRRRPRRRRGRRAPDVRGSLRARRQLAAGRGRRGRGREQHAGPPAVRRAAGRGQAGRAARVRRRRRPAPERRARERPPRSAQLGRRARGAAQGGLQAGGAERHRQGRARHQRGARPGRPGQGVGSQDAPTPRRRGDGEAKRRGPVFGVRDVRVVFGVRDVVRVVVFENNKKRLVRGGLRPGDASRRFPRGVRERARVAPLRRGAPRARRPGPRGGSAGVDPVPARAREHDAAQRVPPGEAQPAGPRTARDEGRRPHPPRGRPRVAAEERLRQGSVQRRPGNRRRRGRRRKRASGVRRRRGDERRRVERRRERVDEGGIRRRCERRRRRLRRRRRR